MVEEDLISKTEIDASNSRGWYRNVKKNSEMI